MSVTLQTAPTPVIIDTDPGVDDALALVFALRSGLFDVKAITVVAGNCPVDQGVENTFRILEVLSEDFSARGFEWNPPPVYRGAERPLGIDHTDALHVHGSDGLGSISVLKEGGQLHYPKPAITLSEGHAVHAMLNCVRHHPEEITLVTLGPLTNVALALQQDKKTMSLLRGIVCMGGAFGTAGNVTPVAEYNVWADPEACEVLVETYGRWSAGIADHPRLTFVGLDVTHTLALIRERLDNFSGGNTGNLSRFLRDCTAETMEFHRQYRGFEGLYLHDPLAVVCAARPDLFTFSELPVSIECNGAYSRGMTIADHRKTSLLKMGVSVKVCTSVSGEEALELLRMGWYGDPIDIFKE